jgi:rubrerythrin
MMELKELLMDIRKELRCAEYYAKEAEKHKREYPELAEVYHRISADKMAHAEMLHKEAHKMATKHGMTGVWEIEDYMVQHDMDEVRKCHEKYRG